LIKIFKSFIIVPPSVRGTYVHIQANLS